MSSLEMNKIAAGVLIAGLTAIASGAVAEALYNEEAPAKRGFSIEVAAADTAAAPAAAAEAPEILDLKALMAKADAKAGEEAFKKCAACHTTGKGEPNKVGPNLWDVVNKPMAGVAGFAYSKGMTAKGGKWDYQSLFAFLKKPKAFIDGTKMTFAGIASPEERANVVAFLRSKSDSPKPLP